MNVLFLLICVISSHSYAFSVRDNGVNVVPNSRKRDRTRGIGSGSLLCTRKRFTKHKLAIQKYDVIVGERKKEIQKNEKK